MSSGRGPGGAALPGRGGLALALASGAVLALSFPKFGHPAFAWVALAPLVIAVTRAPVGRAFVLGLVAGGVYFGGALYWITGVMATYGDMSRWVALLINVGLVAYLALYCGAFAAGIAFLTRTGSLSAIWLGPAWWVALELARTHLLTGFPWVLLGYSQQPVPAVIQLACVTGVFGVSGLLVLTGTLLAFWGLEPRLHMRVAATLAVTTVVAATVGLGAVRLRRHAEVTGGVPITVGLVQAEFPLLDRESQASATLAHHLDLSERAIRQGARLIVWPESAAAFYFKDQPVYAMRLRQFTARHQVALLFGGDDLQRDGPTFRLYNGAYLLTPEGRVAMTYHKMHLVPFGEYVPLRRLLFFVDRLVGAVSDYTPGKDFALGAWGGGRLSTAICYEIIYPALIRRFVRDGSELLTTITDDAWFGRTSAPYQHFAQAAFRAVETGRYLIRAANTGVTGIVDPYGRVLASTDLFVSAVLTGEVRFLDARTPYVAYGDLFAWACVAISAGAFAAAATAARRSRRMRR